MVVGMATVKVTVTLPHEQVETIRRLIADGRATSVSGFVQHAVGVAIDDAAGWGAVLARALAETGGDLTAEEREWADRVLGIKPTKKGTRPAA
jgi:Arc/MetJ-type ribon-helix-helix transcriptional regulator